jgi:hypothetical protein
VQTIRSECVYAVLLWLNIQRDFNTVTPPYLLRQSAERQNDNEWQALLIQAVLCR